MSSCDQVKRRPNTFTEMSDFYFRQRYHYSHSSISALNCPHSHRSRKNYSFLSKLLHHHNLVLPTAYCVSQQNQVMTLYENESEELNLPGIRMKNRDSPSIKTIGEYEINQLMATESGWDRVKHMYRVKSYSFEDESTKALNTMFFRTVMVGFFVSAMIESVKQDKVEKNLSRTNAMREAIASKILLPKEVFKSALKDTLKLSILSLSLLHLSQTMSAYKNKTSVWEFTISSAIGFGAVGITQGPYKFGVLAGGGAILGTVGGWLVCQVLQSSGLTQESRSMKRMQQRVEELRLQQETDE